MVIVSATPDGGVRLVFVREKGQCEGRLLTEPSDPDHIQETVMGEGDEFAVTLGHFDYLRLSAQITDIRFPDL
jgi:hypothetical protein